MSGSGAAPRAAVAVSSARAAASRRNGAKSRGPKTPKGKARYREMNARFLTIASTMGAGLTEASIRKTIDIVRRLSEEVKGPS